jgi:hypothetical protein
MIRAKLLRARFSRLFTVPRLVPGDLGDLLVGLPLQLAEHEDDPVVLRQLPHRLLHQSLQVPLPEEIVRPVGVVLPLQGCASASQCFLMVWKSTSGFRERFRSSFFARLLAMV